MSRIPGTALAAAMQTLIPEVILRIRPRTFISNRALWRELSSCVLGSQVPHEVARAATRELDRLGLLYSTTIETGLRRRKSLLQQIEVVLSKPLNTAVGFRRYRFPKTRANQLASAWGIIRDRFGTLCQLLREVDDPVQVRMFLVDTVSGVGPKQASMFLRNIGFTYDFAVIDTHVSSFMLRTGLCDDLPSNMGSLPNYEYYETILKREAATLGYPVGIVDWAIWFVMRAARELEREWHS